MTPSPSMPSVSRRVLRRRAERMHAVGRRLATALGAMLLVSCRPGSSEPIVSCDGAPTGVMSGRIDGKPWAAGLQTTATPVYIDGVLVSITVVGVPCTGLADRASRLQLRVVRVNGVEAGTTSLGPVPPTSRNSAFGSVTVSGVDYRSDWSDAAGAGSGTLQLVTVSPLRVEGRFEFTAVVNDRTSTRPRIAVTTGTFDIPLSATPLASGMP